MKNHQDTNAIVFPEVPRENVYYLHWGYILLALGIICLFFSLFYFAGGFIFGWLITFYIHLSKRKAYKKEIKEFTSELMRLIPQLDESKMQSKSISHFIWLMKIANWLAPHTFTQEELELWKQHQDAAKKREQTRD